MDTIKITLVKYFGGKRKLFLSDDWEILKPLSEKAAPITEVEYEIYSNDLPEFRKLLDCIFLIANGDSVDSDDKEKIDLFKDIITRVERKYRPEVEKPRSEEDLKVYK